MISKSELIEFINLTGGKENIISLTYYSGKLRFILKDKENIRINDIERLDWVKATHLNIGEFQLVVEDDANSIFNMLMEILWGNENFTPTKKIRNKKYVYILQRYIHELEEIFVPILPAIIAGGIIIGFSNIFGKLNIFGDGTQTLAQINSVIYQINSFISLIGDAIFNFLPVAVMWSTVKKFGGSEILGIIIGAILVSPSLLNASEYGQVLKQGIIPVWNLNWISIQKVGYQEQVIPAILSGLALAKIEINLRKYISDELKPILVPTLTIMIVALLSFVVIGPISREISTYIANIFNYLLTGPFKIFGAIIFGLTYAPLVIIGIHHTLIAVDLQLIASGGTLIWPLAVLSNISQGSAAIAMLIIYRRNKDIKSVAASSGISAWIGITEPAMFAINLKYNYPFIAALIGSASAAVVSITANVKADSIGIAGLQGILPVQTRYWGEFIIAMGFAIVVPMILTFIFHSKNKESIIDI